MNKRLGVLASALVLGILSVAEVGIAATQPRNIAPGPCILRGRRCEVAPKPCSSNPSSPRCGQGSGAGTGTGTGGGRGSGSGSGIPGPFTGR
jgi:hypothetical protein